MDKEQLKEEIVKLEEDIQNKKAELANVQEQLGGPTEEGNQPVGQPEMMQGSAEEGQEDPEKVQLKEKEKELVSQITAEQMRLVALKKQLEEMGAQEMMNNYGMED